VKGASDRYLRDLAERWRRSEGEPRRDVVDALFRDLLSGLGPFTREEIEVLCRGVSVAAMATLMASLGRPFQDPEEALTFVQLLACRAAVEAENARRA
jgi:cytochrome P450